MSEDCRRCGHRPCKCKKKACPRCGQVHCRCEVKQKVKQDVKVEIQGIAGPTGVTGATGPTGATGTIGQSPRNR